VSEAAADSWSLKQHVNTIETLPPATGKITDQYAGHHSPAVSPGQRVFRWSMAACLVLGGVLIGLFISYSRQSSNISQLSAMVQQIQQREQRAATDRARNAQKTTVTAPAATVTDSITTPPEIVAERNSDASQVAPAGTSVKKKSLQPLPAAGTDASSAGSTEKKAPVTPQPAEQPGSKIPEAAKDVNRDNLYKLLSLQGSKYKTGILGGISNLKLELTNNSLVDLHRVEVEVKYLGPERKLIRSQIVAFQNVAAGAQVTLDVPKSNRGVYAEYSIGRID